MPLSGIKVLDLSRIISGPFCSMILADFGAEVIKVESPAGDATRVSMVFGEEGENPYFVGLNRNKRSLVLNLKKDRGKEVFRRLAKWADVLIENFRPGVMERLELGYKDLCKINPGLIYASISGFGLTGPYKDRPAFDFIAQALSGFMSLNGDENTPPLRCGLPISDNITGLYLAFGIMAALRRRDQTGKGQELTCALMDALMSCYSFASGAFFHTGELPPRTGNDHMAVSPYGVYEAADGPLAVAPSTAQTWVSLCKVLEREDLLEDPRFKTNALRRENRSQINRIVADIIKTKTRQEWMDLLNPVGVPAGPINNLREAFEDPQVRHQKMVMELPQPGGPVKAAGFALKMKDTPARVEMPSPQLGEHTRQVLSQMGYSEKEAEDMLKEGVVQDWDGLYDVDRLKAKG